MQNLLDVLPLIAIVTFVVIAFFIAFFMSRAAAHEHDHAWPEQNDGEAGNAATH